MYVTLPVGAALSAVNVRPVAVEVSEALLVAVMFCAPDGAVGLAEIQL